MARGEPISRIATRARSTSSLFGRLLRLPDETLVYPAHDYKGDTVSTIGEERAWNPRLQVKSAGEYVDLMNSLRLANPKMMDVAVPANMKQGLAQEQIARRGWAYSAEEAKTLVGKPNVVLIDLREKHERERDGKIPGALHPALPRPAGEHLTKQRAAHARCNPGQETIVLLCFRRTLRNGGASCAGRRISAPLATSRGVSMPGRRRAVSWTTAPAAQFMLAVAHSRPV